MIEKSSRDDTAKIKQYNITKCQRNPKLFHGVGNGLAIGRQPIRKAFGFEPQNFAALLFGLSPSAIRPLAAAIRVANTRPHFF